MEFDTDSFDILIDNCCSHTLTNDINVIEVTSQPAMGAGLNEEFC